MKVFLALLIGIVVFGILPTPLVEAAQIRRASTITKKNKLPDGSQNKKNKKKKPVRKKKVVKKRPKFVPTTRPLPPFTAEVVSHCSSYNSHFVINIHFQKLFTQSMRLVDGVIKPLRSDGSVAEKFDDPQDQRFAEALRTSLKPEEMSFSALQTVLKKPSISTIVLVRDKWKENDDLKVYELIKKQFGTVQAHFITGGCDLNPPVY